MEYYQAADFLGLKYTTPPTMMENNRVLEAEEMVIRDSYLKSSPGCVAYADTNITPLNGSVIKLDEYYNRISAAKVLFAYTTTNVYKYSTTNKLFECMTDGEVVEDCEDIWTDATGGDVTPTVDSTYFMKGSKSAKLDVKSTAGVELLAYSNDPSAQDLTGFTHLHFYVRCSVVLAASDLAIVMDDSASCASPIEDLDIPAVPTINTWQEVQIAITTPASYDAIESIGIKQKVDKGAMIIYIDDLRAITPFAATENIPVSSVTIPTSGGTWYYIFSKGADGIRKWAGSADTVSTLTGWTAYGARAIFGLGERLVAIRTYESDVDQSIRIRWSATKNIEDTTSSSAGFTDLVAELRGGEIVTGGKVGDLGVIYGTKSIVLMRTTGQATNPFTFEVAVTDKVIVSPKGLFIYEDTHFLLCRDGIFGYNGSGSLIPIDEDINLQFRREVNDQYVNRTFFSYDNIHNELLIHFPSGASEYPDKYFRVNIKDKKWLRGTRTFTGWGEYSNPVGGTIADLTGTIDSLVGSIDSLAAQDSPIILYGDKDGKIWKGETGNDIKGSAQNCYFSTKDYNVDKYLKNGACWMEMNIECRGSGTLTPYYSVDFGVSWIPLTDTITLTSDWSKFIIGFEVNDVKFRMRLRNANSGEYFEVRYFDVGYLKQSDRGFS